MERKILLEVIQLVRMLVLVAMWWDQLFLFSAYLQNYTTQSSAMYNQSISF